MGIGNSASMQSLEEAFELLDELGSLNVAECVVAQIASTGPGSAGQAVGSQAAPIKAAHSIVNHNASQVPAVVDGAYTRGLLESRVQQFNDMLERWTTIVEGQLVELTASFNALRSYTDIPRIPDTMQNGE